MSLRSWQRECVDAALAKYENKPNFLCMATPGAGKTVMAASVASRLVAQNKIDFIFCFAPSRAVAASIEETFSLVLGGRFDGLIGSLGGVYTYQAMSTLNDSIWDVLEMSRVFVVLDEIHHCAAYEDQGFNTWGDEIHKRIKNKAVYTLSLTGTPWRSDLRPIALANYNNLQSGDLHCDFSYALREAIQDGACRPPSVVLLDNDHLSYSASGEAESFPGLPELFEKTDASYQSVLNNDNAVTHCLSLACQRLDSIRINSPLAGGLIVASSVKHALFIADLLRTQFNECPLVVNHQNPMADKTIEDFRVGDERWIISVGMISEGTDIPRLQVCCHLSRVKTELYFRQVLGRILRTTRGSTGHAWLYTFAEPSLKLFASRLADEVPTAQVRIVKSPQSFKPISHQGPEHRLSRVDACLDWGSLVSEQVDYASETGGLVTQTRDFLCSTPSSSASGSYSLDCLGKFRQTLIPIHQ